MRIARIGQIAALVVTYVHPVVNLSFESLIELFFERRFGGWIPGRRRFLGESDPAIIGAEDRYAFHTANLERVPVASSAIHMKEPCAGLQAEGEQLSVRT